MPLLAHGIDHTALNGSPTGPADGNAHLVVAGQTVELPLQLPGIRGQLLTAETEVKKIRSAQNTQKHIPQNGLYTCK